MRMHEMLEKFLEFYGLEISYMLSGTLRIKKKGSSVMVDLCHEQMKGVTKCYYTSYEHIARDAFACDSLSLYGNGELWKADNIFKGCKSLEEMEIRKDLFGANPYFGCESLEEAMIRADLLDGCSRQKEKVGENET